jgi:hypothetical protein
MEIDVENIGDNERNLYRVTASRGSNVGVAMASYESKAIQLAKQALFARENLIKVNWENTPESFLAKVSFREVFNG